MSTLAKGQLIGQIHRVQNHLSAQFISAAIKMNSLKNTTKPKLQ